MDFESDLEQEKMKNSQLEEKIKEMKKEKNKNKDGYILGCFEGKDFVFCFGCENNKCEFAGKKVLINPR